MSLSALCFGQDVETVSERFHYRYLKNEQTKEQIKKDNEAEISLINDFGSEDLQASLFCHNDTTYVLHQLKGSTLKIPKNGKWQKLPKYLVLKRKKD